MSEAAARITDDDRPVRRPANRRELILEAAIELFDERGYPATGVDDIGKAVDVSGPAIYRHFDSKEDILLEAIRLAADEVHEANQSARQQADGPWSVLEGYARAYARVAIGRSALISVWTSEARHLSAERRSPMTRRLRSWTGEWARELRAARAGLDDHQITTLVTGAIGLVTTTATTMPDDGLLEDRVTAMAMAVLATEIS